MATTDKLSISLDRQLLAEARTYAGGNLSRWIGEAVEQRVLLERGRELLRELEAERGPSDQALLDDIRARWHGSSSTPGS